MIEVIEYPAMWCRCHPDHSQWNGYGSCLRCGGAYEAKDQLAPIVVPRTESEEQS